MLMALQGFEMEFYPKPLILGVDEAVSVIDSKSTVIGNENAYERSSVPEENSASITSIILTVTGEKVSETEWGK
jgi:hypothetical protein